MTRPKKIMVRCDMEGITGIVHNTSIAIEGENTSSTWAEYWQMMLQTQAQIAKIA